MMEKQTVSRVEESSQKEKSSSVPRPPFQMWKHLDGVAEKLAQILCHRR